MKHYTKIISALVALGIGGGAHAAAFEKVAPVGECSGENVVVPCEQNGWHVGAQYIYVQPTGDQLYTDLSSNSKWASGFRLEGGYHFGTGNDVTVNWTYFSKSSRRNITLFGDIPSTLLSDEDIDELVLSPVSPERVKSKFNAVNLEFGQLAHWGSQVSTRLHAGLQYAQIKRERSHLNLSASFVDTAEEQPESISLATNYHVNQKFTGIGPRVGIDAFYTVGESNLKLVGKAAVAVLAGDAQVTINRFRVNAVSVKDDVVVRDETSVILGPSNRTRALVPALESKLGMEYDYALANGDLVFEAGYQWVSYPQSMQQPVLIDGLGIPGDRSNFGYHGFYVGLKWLGDLA
ncbi:MAG: hypothetical protein GKR77_06985 [Legionellales bacterium]|nr:hypothetical protein [Legionellales bacterium]